MKARLKRRAVCYFGAWEVGVSGILHLHLGLVSLPGDDRSSAELAAAVHGSLLPGWRAWVGAVQDTLPGYLSYIMKAKRRGGTNSDKYANKRRLFRPGIGLFKTVHSDGFWQRPMDEYRCRVAQFVNPDWYEFRLYNSEEEADQVLGFSDRTDAEAGSSEVARWPTLARNVDIFH